MSSSDLLNEFPNAMVLNSSRPFRNRLLKWFDANARDLPWRKNKTPYRIWISEIMLQQTQVATVIDYYLRFMKRFPTVKKLAAADQSDVLKLWEGLGYYRRARQLHNAAIQIVADHNGKFPTNFDDVLALPGIGRYTASAILSISQDQQLPILEGNTIRLYARLLQMEFDPKSSANQKILWRFAESIVPKSRAGDFNQALMELGNRVCKPKNPHCGECPVAKFCPTFVQGLQTEIPAASKKMIYEDITEAILLVRRNGKFLVRQCGEGERWTGLWDFPRYEITGKSSKCFLQQQLKQMTGLNASISSLNKTIKHAVTKYRITLKCFSAANIQGRVKKDSGGKWLSRKQLSSLPMSITGRKICDALDELNLNSNLKSKSKV